jgi:hypothetical protein
MTWSYDHALTQSKDKVRFHIGDTDPGSRNNWLVQDEEIMFALSQEGTVRDAAALMCEHLAARFAKDADKQVGDLRISLSQRAEAYAKTAGRLRNRNSIFVTPSAGGIVIAEKQAQEQDDSKVKPFFGRDMMDNEGAVDSSAQMTED